MREALALWGAKSERRRGFIEVGTALMEIREGRLYREQGYETFEAYCQERWGWSRRYSYNLMVAAEAVSDVCAIAHTDAAPLPPPKNEGQARELARLPDAETRREVWQQVREEHGEAVTAADVRRAADAARGIRGATTNEGRARQLARADDATRDARDRRRAMSGAGVRGTAD